MQELEFISCPLCDSFQNIPWAEENGYYCVKCCECGLIYVNPRPSLQYIQETAALGVHSLKEGKNLDGKAYFKPSKIKNFQHALLKLNQDLAKSKTKWLDVGAGHGEFIFAVKNIVPITSTVEGVDPMEYKVKSARDRGLKIHHGFLSDVKGKYNVISLLDVFSHIPNFKEFLVTIKDHLSINGEIIIKTGNASDVGDRSNIPEPLYLPDHLVFGGYSQLVKFITESGFIIVSEYHESIDGFWYTIKNIFKKILGKEVVLRLPYTSPMKTMWIRARKSTLMEK